MVLVLHLKDWALYELQSMWSGLQTCRQARQLIRGLELKYTKQLLCLNRAKARLVVQLLTGHNVLNRHLSIIGTSNSVCPMCEKEDETSLHFIGECDAYSEVRAKIFGSRYLSSKDIQDLTIGNLLKFVKDSGVYQVTTQLKVVTTVVFMVVMLGRKYSVTRWISVIFLFGGVALVQLGAIQTAETTGNKEKDLKNADQNYFVGISAVLVTCITAGFAGVYFEKMLKDGSQINFWIRNLQLYTSGIISAGLACLGNDGIAIIEKGFFFNYDAKIWIIVGLLSLGGIYISLVMKYLDNLLKSFASSVSIILVCMVSYYLFHSQLGPFFILGSFIVCSAIVLYNSVSE